jgi:flagellar basal-body rod protein FlgC
MGLFAALSVSASGMAAQRARAVVLTENLANSETTRTPEGGPYRRKDVVFTTSTPGAEFGSELNIALGSSQAVNGVSVGEVIQDTREPERRYLPGHPDADKDGYVLMPRINPAEDMVDLMGAARGYQANVSAMSAVKEMIKSSIDLMR